MDVAASAQSSPRAKYTGAPRRIIMGNVFFAVRAVIKSHGDGRREERERERACATPYYSGREMTFRAIELLRLRSRQLFFSL